MSVFIDEWINAPIVLPEGHIEFAIGDSHGLYSELHELVNTVLGHCPDAHITYLGDVIDRGPDSLKCLKYALDTVIQQRRAGHGGDFLLGNHEGMLLGVLTGDNFLTDIFYHNGGMWLKKEFDKRDMSKSWNKKGHFPIMNWFMHELGEERMNVFTKNGALLKRYRNEQVPPGLLYRRIGNLVLVHAGVDPNYSENDDDMNNWLDSFHVFELNDEKHPFWMREDFIYSNSNFAGNIVVHGHTREFLIDSIDYGYKKPGHHCLDGNRLGLDGGSYSTGYVTGALFRNGGYKIITSHNPQ